jgi:hypothetical protein
MRNLTHTVDTSKTEISVRMTMEQYQQVMNLWNAAKMRDLKISDWLGATKNEIVEEYAAFPLEVTEIEVVRFQ